MHSPGDPDRIQTKYLPENNRYDYTVLPASALNQAGAFHAHRRQFQYTVRSTQFWVLQFKFGYSTEFYYDVTAHFIKIHVRIRYVIYKQVIYFHILMLSDKVTVSHVNAYYRGLIHSYHLCNPYCCESHATHSPQLFNSRYRKMDLFYWNIQFQRVYL